MIGLRFFYLMLLICSVAFYIFYVDNLSLYLMIFIFLMPAISAILLFAQRKKISYEIKTHQHNYCRGAEIPLLLTVSNKSRFSVSSAVITIECYNRLSGKTQKFRISSPIFSNNTQTLRLQVTPEHCGILEFKVTTVILYDLFRLCKTKLKSNNIIFGKNSCEILITPEISILNLEVNTSCVANYESSTFSKTKSGDDPSEIFDTHQYKPGDKVNRIHWKLTAKQDELFVKDYSLPLNDAICLLFDSRINSSDRSDVKYSSFDTCMEAMFSISAFLSDENVPHSIVYLSKESGTVEKVSAADPEDLPVIIEAILKNGYDNDNGESVLEHFIADNSADKQYRIIYFTAMLSQDELSTLEEYNTTGNVTVIHAVPEGYPFLGNDDSQSFEIINVDPGKISKCIEYLVI